MCLKSLSYIVQAEVISDVANLLENETNAAIFSCQATGEPVPSISWYFKGVMINVSDVHKYKISNILRETIVTSSLTISNVQSSDVGTYTCQAENIIDIDESSGTLTVNGKSYCKLTVIMNFNCVIVSLYINLCYISTPTYLSQIHLNRHLRTYVYQDSR